MKWYNRANTARYKEDVSFAARKDDKESKLIDTYLPWMPKLALGFSKEYAAIGTLDLNDLIQIANYHLIIAIRNLNWKKIAENSRDDAAIIWKYVKRTVLLSMRDEINLFKDGVRIYREGDPGRKISIKKQTNNEDFITELFGSFFDEQYHYMVDETDTMFDIEQLAKGLDHLMRNALTQQEKQIVEMFYGIDCEPVSQKQIAKIHYVSISQIQNIKHRAIKKLKEYYNNREIISLYYDI